ncbi:MAG: triose-phosphate isomerase [Herminiimonas sp.]|nr:triose-phosphate isomerase [Herminiimonas sp.]
MPGLSKYVDPMRRKLIAGNWKMHGSLAANAALLNGILAGTDAVTCDVAVCVPAPYLAQCKSLLSGSAVAWGAQDVSMHTSGAYTGEMSAAMIKEFDCRYVIVGHSERRSGHAESNEAVGRKAAQALKAGLTPIVCVGETLVQRESGATAEVVLGQLDTILGAISEQDAARIVLAYEPVWAIGTGKTATPDMAQEVHALIRGKLVERNPAAQSVQVLYGGSMKPDNAGQLMSMPDVDGGLIGGAALKVDDFLAIVRAACAAP